MRLAFSRIIRLILATSLTTFVVPVDAFAQVGLVTGSVYQRWMGFQPVAPTVGADISTAHFTNSAWWSPAQKTYVGNGWSLWEQGAAYLNRGSFGAGPAVLIRYTSNSQFEKASIYPSVALQCRSEKWRVESFIHFRDPRTLNHGRGASIAIRRDLTSPHAHFGMSLRASVTILKFSDALPEPYGSVVNVGVVFYRRSPGR